MSEVMIKVTGLTKDYGNQRGIFDLDLEVKQGEVHGFVGTNGSGKTTTIRNIMGFIHPDKGEITVKGMDAWKDATELKKYVSYVPGEIFFPNVGSGTNFLKLQAEYLGIKDLTYMNELIKVLQLDPSAGLKRMSKGMKQKTALVAALMGNKEILVLDEPTTGLDPLMREAFLNLIRMEKDRGKTILMSSHIFEEIEDVCDKVSMIKDGNLLGTLDLNEYRKTPERTFHIEVASEEDLKRFEEKEQFRLTKTDTLTATAIFKEEYLKEFLTIAADVSTKRLEEQRHTLQDAFMEIYEEGKQRDENRKDD